MGTRKKIRIGVIGAGGISQMTHIPNLKDEAEAEIVALSDIDPTRAAMVAKRFEIPKWYDEPEQMLRRAKYDAVVIATPTISHYPLCRFALETGADVFLEKPFTLNAAEARRLVEIAELGDRILMVAMNHRFRDDTIHLKKLVTEGELGELLSIRSGWLKRLGVWGSPYWFTNPKQAGGGVLMDLGVQMIDLVLHLLNFPPVISISGAVSNKMLNLAVEDTATAYFKFSNEATFLLEVSWASCAVEDIAYTYLSGSKGRAALNPLKLVRRQRNTVMQIAPPRLGNPIQIYHRSFKAEIAHFIDCVQKRIPPLSPAREAVTVMELVEGLYKSAAH